MTSEIKTIAVVRTRPRSLRKLYLLFLIIPAMWANSQFQAGGAFLPGFAAGLIPAMMLVALIEATLLGRRLARGG